MFLCRIGLHRWEKYNLGWRRECLRCGRLQVHELGGGGGWSDTTFANRNPTTDTVIYESDDRP